MKIDAQRLRNLTTGRLHTDIGCVYEDLEAITGESGLMTHMLPNVMRSVEPWLRESVKDDRYWDGRFDTTHNGTYELPDPSSGERSDMLTRFIDLPSPLAGKKVIAVEV